MDIFWPTRSINGDGIKVIAIAPAALDRSINSEEFVDSDGDPVTVRAEFKNGKAQVSDALGRFLVDTKRAVMRRPAIATYD